MMLTWSSWTKLLAQSPLEFEHFDKKKLGTPNL